METNKERKERLRLTNIEKATHGSRYYKFIPCEGTLKNVIDKEGIKQDQQIVNYRSYENKDKPLSSTKLGKGYNSEIYRKGRYEKEMLTVLAIMKMTKKQRQQNASAISEFSRVIK